MNGANEPGGALSPLQKSEVLVEALPYIQEFFGKIVVVKFGGHAMTDPDLEEIVLKDVLLMKLIGMNPVLVHGGGPMIDEWLDRLRIEASFVDGLRVTDEPVMEVVEMILNGKINKAIVSRMEYLGGAAVGVCGKDAGLFKARRKTEPRDLGLVGEIVHVNPGIVQSLIEGGFIPVVSPISMGEQGETLNINADSAAGALGGALGAHKLVLLTDVEGIYLGSRGGEGAPQTLASVLKAKDIPEMIRDGVITGGMIPKAECCLEALERGVENVHIINGRKPHSLLLEIFTKEGIGTWVVREDGKR
ncbi:MAG: acetylglutamate kinase [Peptococcaceae bacterium]|jgi:acetylglutamate kinase|nr:acetylglutamate kinase [Peptococcaceae bacterium]